MRALQKTSGVLDQLQSRLPFRDGAGPRGRALGPFRTIRADSTTAAIPEAEARAASLAKPREQSDP